MDISHIEICVASAQSALNAKKAGAVRVELCGALESGGVTPSLALINYCVKTLQLRTHVLIRSRAGSFCYTEAEYEVMKQDVQVCKQLGVSAVVIGFLRADRSVDMERTREIVRLAAPMEVTFHRAFDLAVDKEKALEDVIACGCHRLLTSGGEKNAYQGLGMLRRLKEQAADRILIMAGAGIASANAAEIASITGVDELHASCKKLSKDASYLETDEDEVRALFKVLSKGEL